MLPRAPVPIKQAGESRAGAKAVQPGTSGCRAMVHECPYADPHEFLTI